MKLIDNNPRPHLSILVSQHICDVGEGEALHEHHQVLGPRVRIEAVCSFFFNEGSLEYDNTRNVHLQFLKQLKRRLFVRRMPP